MRPSPAAERSKKPAARVRPRKRSLMKGDFMAYMSRERGWPKFLVAGHKVSVPLSGVLINNIGGDGRKGGNNFIAAMPQLEKSELFLEGDSLDEPEEEL